MPPHLGYGAWLAARERTFIICILMLCRAIAEGVSPPLPPPTAQRFQVDTYTQLKLMDKRFLSVSMDQSLITVWDSVPFDSPHLLALAAALRPAYLRFGSRLQDVVTLLPTPPLPPSAPPPRALNEPIFFAPHQLDRLLNFSSVAGLPLMFGLNAATKRTKLGLWNATEARWLLSYLASKSANVTAFTLGSEPDQWAWQYNVSVSAQNMAEDFQAISKLLKTSKSRLIGPDLGSFNMKFLIPFFLALDAGTRLSAASAHFRHFTAPVPPDRPYAVSLLDSFLNQSLVFARLFDVYSPTTEFWLSETALCGRPVANCSTYASVFISGFSFLDSLAISAIVGTRVVVRQSLWGGPYALVGADLIPRPDFWSAVLFKQLVGTRVLTVADSMLPGRAVRVYSFCTLVQQPLVARAGMRQHRATGDGNGDDDGGDGRLRLTRKYAPGAVTMLVINTQSVSAPVFFDLTHENGDSASFDSLTRDEYILTASDGYLLSASVLMNGFPLGLDAQRQVPFLNALSSPAGLQPLVLPPYSFGFVVLPDANAQACLIDTEFGLTTSGGVSSLQRCCSLIGRWQVLLVFAIVIVSLLQQR